MSLRAGYSAKQLTFGFAIVAIGILVGIISVVSLTSVRPVLFLFAFGGLVLLLPALVIRDQRAYWLFLLVLSIPFDVSKRTTSWLVHPLDLYHKFGMPPYGTLSVDFYLTDVVLFALLVPWLARICLRRDTFYFPKVGYYFVLYLLWTLIVALFQAPSFYLAIFEWCRQLLYFSSFLYLINNVVTRTQFRAVILALFIGLSVACGSVIAFYYLQIGTEKTALSELYKDQRQSDTSGQGTLYSKEASGSDKQPQTKRSAGIFTHPSHAAYYIEYILPVVLAFLLTTLRTRNRLLFGVLFGAGWVALYMTFARSPVVALVCGCVVVVSIARWSEALSRQAFTKLVLTFAITAAVSAPLLVEYLTNRPQSFTKRFELNLKSWSTFLKQPILGAGLNNSSIVTEGAQSSVLTSQGSVRQPVVVHNHYLLMLVEVGLVGFLLYFAFFWRIVVIALSHLRACEMETKLLLIGIVGSLVSVAIHNLGDPFGGHVVHAMLWLHAGLVIAICRRFREGDVEHPDRLAVAR
jgi:hypothetical protein